MAEQVDVSLIISTYNRCDLLEKAISSALDQDAPGISYEIIAVDNNSTDNTKQVIESFVERGANVRYIFERAQGVSHGRNAGITRARAPIIGFTDDDIRISRDWVANVKRAFDKHPEVAFVGGKVLPLWKGSPPAWLTREHWTPLALLDHGESELYLEGSKQIGLVGANLAVRRRIFDEIGMFSPQVQRVKDGIGSLEDHEFLLRVWRVGQVGLYVPELVVTTHVSKERLTKRYHRRWYKGHGYFYAIMHDAVWEHSRIRFLRVPGHLYRQTALDALIWIKKMMAGKANEAFVHEVNLRFFGALFLQRQKDAFSRRSQIPGGYYSQPNHPHSPSL